MTITRLAGFAEVPTDVYVTGEGSEGGADLSKAIKFKAVANGEFASVEEAAEKIGQVTAEEVRAFVQKHFDLSQMSLSLVGDLKTLPREEMEELWMTYRMEKA